MTVEPRRAGRHELTRDTERRDCGTRLQALTRNAVNGQWSLEEDIDWERRAMRPWWLPARHYVTVVSQLYHAERATLEMCTRLLDELPEAAAKQFLRTQLADETRHIAVYAAYLARLGDIAPVDEAVATALEGGLAWRGSTLGAITAFHIVLEGEAVRLQNDLAEFFPCPLLRSINIRIARDEARHVAFGRIYLRDRLAALPGDERLAIYRWVKELWQACARANSDCRRGGGAAIIQMGNRRLEERWLIQRRALADIGLISQAELALV